MNLSTQELNEINNFIRKTLSLVKCDLDEESYNAVEHYLNHDEYEMAFEGLFIELIQSKSKPIIDFKNSRKIALALGLDKESVFDGDFWIKFEKFLRKKSI